MRTNYWLLIASMSGLFAVQSALAAPVTAAEVESVLSEYCHALAVGDTQTLKALMGGDHLKEMEERLNDLAYADFLRSRYSDSRCKVDGSTIVAAGGDRVEASLIIDLSQGDVVVTRFRLGREGGSGQLQVLEELAEASE